MPRKKGGIIKFDLECFWCNQSIPKKHSAYIRYTAYIKVKEGKPVFCSKSCGLKSRHANLTPRQKKIYGNKIANTRKSRSPEENAKSVAKLRMTWSEKSHEEREDIVKRTLATKESRGNKNIWAKAEKTMIKRMGINYGKKRAAKAEKTMLQKYGIPNALIKESKFRERARRTNIARYGYEIASSNPRIAAKIVNTTIRRHGGMGRASKSSNSKYEATMMDTYSVTNPMKCEPIKKKVAESYKKVGKYKAMMTKEENRTTPKDVAWKGYETKKKNGSYKVSKPEQYILQRLRSLLGSQVIHLYRGHPDYPWEADFYDPRTGTIYEYQGYFTHDKEPYDPENKEHRKLVRKLKANIETDRWASKLHLEIWTQKDPLKRSTAKENNIPFVEWFGLVQFEKWLANKIKKLFGAIKVRDNCFKLENGTYVAYSNSGYVGTNKCDIVFHSDTDLRKLIKSFKGTK